MSLQQCIVLISIYYTRSYTTTFADVHLGCHALRVILNFTRTMTLLV